MTTLAEAPPVSIPCPIRDYLKRLHDQFADCHEGEVATYIPELAKANPDWFGISLVTTSGEVYEVGDTRQSFTIQSISKPFTYGVALEDNGRDAVLEKIGVEPTGDAFNSISLDPVTGQPANPMINAGAIAATGLVAGKTSQEKIHRILDAFSRYVGRPMKVDEEVFRSESLTGHRNRAITYMLRNFDILGDEALESLDAYFRQCSILVDCRDLGMMAATVANGGVNPVTRTRAVVSDYIPNILGVMSSCGMYDYAGEWVYKVGMPAKSGVAGGIVAVLPGKLGVAVFSPRLDPRGNSVRGIKVCQELSRHFDLHMFNVLNVQAPVIRRKLHGSQIQSNCRRSSREELVLRGLGKKTAIYYLQGELDFAAIEVVLREIRNGIGESDFFIIDCKQVVKADEPACWMLSELVKRLVDQKVEVFLVETENLTLLRRILKSVAGAEASARTLAFDSVDWALEACEDLLLESLPDEEGLGADGGSQKGHDSLARIDETLAMLDQSELFNGLNDSDLSILNPMLQERTYEKGSVIVDVGDPADGIYVVIEGRASALIGVADTGKDRRLATFTPGMAFGELAVLDRAPRSALVAADEKTRCWIISPEDFDSLGDNHPKLKIKLLENLAMMFAARLRKANREIAALEV